MRDAASKNIYAIGPLLRAMKHETGCNPHGKVPPATSKVIARMFEASAT